MATEAQITAFSHAIVANRNASPLPPRGKIAPLPRRPTLSFPSFRRAVNRSVILEYFARCKAQSFEEEHQTPIVDLRVPNQWLVPSRALEQSEWLRVTLHKWLDDEYCPEPTNIEISKVAAKSFHESLVGGRTDIGEILLKMASDLESISYQESFHGAFSSANAAINLIAERIELDGP
ncbi:uncharacterized protein [Aristolochia californica]|uniref:uncharacterized protein n=1 Tax=Aristolochia californica TaxID=171875 RepID=UPI0035D84D76